MRNLTTSFLILLMITTTTLIAQNFFPLSIGNKFQVEKTLYGQYISYHKIEISDFLISNGKIFYKYIDDYFHMDTVENKLFILVNSQIELAVDFNIPQGVEYTSFINGFAQTWESEGTNVKNVLGENRLCHRISYWYEYDPGGPNWFTEASSYEFCESVGNYKYYWSLYYHDPPALNEIENEFIAIITDSLVYNPFSYSISLISTVVDKPINQFPFQIIAGIISNYDVFIDSIYADFYVFREDTNLVYHDKYPFAGILLRANVELDSTVLEVGDLIKFRCVLTDSTIFEGRYFDPDAGYYQFRVLPAVTGIEEEILNSYALELSNYPNPFNPSTQVEFSIPFSTKVSLKVYDILGREISVLVDEFLISGNHIVSFSGENSPSGIYLCRLQTQNGSIQRKMVLLR